MPPPLPAGSHPEPASTDPRAFLGLELRRARGTLLAWSLALAALGSGLDLALHLRWLPADTIALDAAVSLLGLTSALLLVLWLRRSARLDRIARARELDRHLTLSARLESAAELARDPSAFAAAQRADTARQLASRPPPPALAWRSAQALATLAFLMLAVELTQVALRALLPAPALEPAAPMEIAPDLSASITWKEPESEIKATAIEQIPLAALAQSRTGFRALSLEVSVNGEPRLSLPAEPALLASLAQPGPHALELDLYLDEAAVQEFDLVSYHLRAERIPPPASPAELPPVTSPLQFIQIRPAREDVIRETATGSGADKCAALLAALKTAQLQLLKQNFLLAHSPLDRSLPAWREENTRVAADQLTLARKTTEARDFAIAEGLPTLVVDNLGQSIPFMDTAATGIAEAANEAATTPQGRALALIVAAEKVLRKVIREGGGGGPSSTPKVSDPFRDQQQFKLPPRASTPAGQLEQLAQAQADAASPASGAEKDPLAGQAELAARLAALDQARELDPAARDHVADAARDAADAAEQLRAGDSQAARAPAAAAAEALRRATAAQEAAGRSAAQAGLEKLRREINAAEKLEDPAARSAALEAAAAALRAEALAQQRTGSAEAAERLAQTASQVARAAGSPAPAPGAEPGKEKGSGEGEGPGSGPSPKPEPSSAPPSPSASSPPAPGAAGDSAGQGSSPGGGPASPSPAGSAPAPSGSTPGSSPGQSPGETGGTGQGVGAPSASSAAAEAQVALTPRDEALARAARQLARGADATRRDQAEDRELGAQLVLALFADGEPRDLAILLTDETRRDHLPAGDLIGRYENLRDVAQRLVLLLETARQSGSRDEQVRRFQADDIPPAYREAVETYFEKLSREAAPRQP